jgi:hypothetical protein
VKHSCESTLTTIFRTAPTVTVPYCYRDRSLPLQLSTAIASYRDRSLPLQLSTATAPYRDRSLPLQLSTATAPYRDRSLPLQHSTATAPYRDRSLPLQLSTATAFYQALNYNKIIPLIASHCGQADKRARGTAKPKGSVLHHRCAWATPCDCATPPIIITAIQNAPSMTKSDRHKLLVEYTGALVLIHTPTKEGGLYRPINNQYPSTLTRGNLIVCGEKEKRRTAGGSRTEFFKNISHPPSPAFRSPFPLPASRSLPPTSLP